MSKAEELANELYPDPKLENYDDVLVYRADRDNAIMGRVTVIRAYEQAEKDLALTWEDMKAIICIDEEMMDDPESHPEWMEEQPFYEEVLRRFNERKK